MLIPNIVPDYFCRYFVANRSDKVTIIPEFPAPKLFLYRGKLSEHYLGGNTFDHLHNSRWCILRGNNQKQMHMIIHYFHRVYFQIVLLGYLLKYFLQSIRHPIIEQFLSIFRNPYKMVLQVIDTMSASFQWAHGPYCIRFSS
jgi:hypothetical protein